MKRFVVLTLSLAPVIVSLTSCDQGDSPASSSPDAGPPLVITNGILIDGTGSDPIPDAVILIEGGFISSVGTDSSVGIPAGAELIDVQGSYVLPGFMNTHVHGGYNEGNLKEWARSGVTTVRDLGDLEHSPAESFAIRNALLNDHRNARLVAAGPLVTTVGGYGNYPVTSPSDARQKVNGLIDGGAELIKIAIEDDLQGRRWPMLSMDEITMIVQTAHQRNRMVATHISRSRQLEMAIEGGVDDVVHMVVDLLPDSLIYAMVQKDIFWVPTLELWAGVSQLHDVTWDVSAKSNLRRFVQAGGKVATGTDYDGYVTPFELGMPMAEMRLMQEAGMTPMQIIIAGTRHAAHVCNRDADLGTIEAGKIADILIVKGNPLDDLGALLNVQIVIHNGEKIRETILSRPG